MPVVLPDMRMPQVLVELTSKRWVGARSASTPGACLGGLQTEDCLRRNGLASCTRNFAIGGRRHSAQLLGMSHAGCSQGGASSSRPPRLICVLPCCSCGCVLVADAELQLEGIFTDGDLRRTLQQVGDLRWVG